MSEANDGRELREFISDQWFGRDLNGKLVDSESGFSAAVQQLRSQQVTYALRCFGPTVLVILSIGELSNNLCHASYFVCSCQCS